MERPILNPSIFDDPDRLPDAPTQARTGIFGAMGRLLRTVCISGPLAMVRFTWCVLKMPVHRVRARAQSPDPERRSVIVWLIGPVVFRLMFCTLLTLGTVVGIVHVMTHPMLAADPNPSPICPGLLVESLQLQAADGATVPAWHIHALDERQVLAHKDVAARARWPAVVLVPDQRGDGHELDRFIRPLHEQGYVLMVVRLRGAGSETARTFGLLERQDVAAAVANLRGRRYVDASRISVIGNGTGASAALLARRDDAAIDRVLAYNPVADFDEVLAESVNAAWLRPACRWAFEVMQQVDVEELDAASIARQIGSDAVVFSHPPVRGPEMPRIASLLRSSHVASARE